MREVWLARYETAVGIFQSFPAWAAHNREFENWFEMENELEAKKEIRHTYSTESLFLMGLEDLTEMEINTLYTLPWDAIGCFVESNQNDKGGEDDYDE